jgi:hypothetical protein
VIAGYLTAALYTAVCIPPSAMASDVVVTITGTVLEGSDTSGSGTSGLFAAPHTDLTGRSFTLTFTFDDTKGTETDSYCCSQPPILYKSEFDSPNPNATGNVVLQIGGVSYAYPPPTGPNGSVADRTGGPIGSTAYFFSSVQDQINDSDAVALVYPAPGGVLSPNVNWKSPFAYFNLEGYGVYAAHVSVATTAGYLAADVSLAANTITVSGPVEQCPSINASTSSHQDVALSGLATLQPDGIVDCAEALAELVSATANLQGRILNEVLNQGQPDPMDHGKAIAQAVNRLNNALTRVKKHCPIYAGAAAAIAAAEAALEAAVPYLLCVSLL